MERFEHREEKLTYLIPLVLQQGLQLLAQHQGAEVRDGHRVGVRPFSAHTILGKKKEKAFTLAAPSEGPLCYSAAAGLTDTSCRLQGRLLVETPWPGLWE